MKPGEKRQIKYTLLKAIIITICSLLFGAGLGIIYCVPPESKEINEVSLLEEIQDFKPSLREITQILVYSSEYGSDLIVVKTKNKEKIELYRNIDLYGYPVYKDKI